MASPQPGGDRVQVHFDATQTHQRHAVDAVCDLLRGQPRARFGGEAAQALLIDDARLLSNLNRVRGEHGLAPVDGLDGYNASVEMETGTGKTYVYLRTIRELHRRYGLDRFVVVVPSVAIREGLLQQARQMDEHFSELYPESEVTTRVFRPGRDSEVRRFAFDAGIQVLVLNIDAFNKGKGNLIHRPTDTLRGHRPIDLIAQRRPVVILDEPQNMEGPRAQEAIASLQPLWTLRYSATHRRLRNLVYRLDPVQAYDLGLVKRIEVASVVAEHQGPPPIEVRRIRATTRGVSASLMLEVAASSGPARKSITVRGQGESLAELSGRELYAGWTVSAVDAEARVVRFSNGVSVPEGAVAAPEARDAVMRQQLEETIREHLETELKIRRLQKAAEQMKVLSLVFIDRVANYIGEGGVPGAIQRWFDTAYERQASRPRYAMLNLPPAHAVRAAYFSERRGAPVDTTGKSKDDDQAYALIMQDKTRLLSLSEPVRFIFSHSALREGWDNPNVFQICTLHRTRSELKKRQEIGRGLRLPVMANGRRCHDQDLARLTLVANESYESFARQLQAEISEECAVDFAHRVVDKRVAQGLPLRAGWREDTAFLRLWRRVGRPLSFHVSFPPETMREGVIEALRGIEAANATRVTARRARLELGGDGVVSTALEAGRTRAVESNTEVASATMPDPLSALQRETGLTRSTLAEGLIASGRVPTLQHAPVAFLDAASEAIRGAIRRITASHARYECSSESSPDIVHFEARPMVSSGRHLVPTTRSIYESLSARSAAEAEWLRTLDADPEVDMVLPWPAWHRIDSPVGPLDLGWIVSRGDRIACSPPAAHARDPAARSCLVAVCHALGLDWLESGLC